MNDGDLPPTRVSEFLSSDPRFERVPADPEYARRVVEDLAEEECDLALYAAVKQRWSKVNTLTYDAARKAVEGLLLDVGWRVRPVAGAHAGVGEIVRIWLGTQPPPGPRIADKFAASRKARHDDEYPNPSSRHRTDPELRALAQDNVRIVGYARELLALPARPDLVPNDENLDVFRQR